MKTAVNILLAIILFIIAISFVLVYANTHPPRYPLHIPPSEYGADFEALSFVSGDGVDLKGWLVKPPRREPRMPAVIICHGVGANKSDFTDLAVSLSRRGYLVLTFDFRAHGESGGRRTSLGYHEQKDAKAALDYLLSRSDVAPDRIGIFGFSLGGAVAILAAAETKRFAAVAADSAFTSLRDQAREAITGFYHLPAFPFLHFAVFGYELYFQTKVDRISPISAVDKIAPAPLLIIAGEGDRLIPADNGRKLYQAAREPKELWIISGAEHGGTIAAAGGEYGKRVGEFFDRNLMGKKH
jgi:dipeptidyl aminopeptidase/acylaminoacyl peptidase